MGGRVWNLGNEVTLRPMEIKARPARVIEGMVTGAGGVPVEGAMVEATLREPEYGYLNSWEGSGLVVRTNARGSFGSRGFRRMRQRTCA